MGRTSIQYPCGFRIEHQGFMWELDVYELGKECPMHGKKKCVKRI